jgi:hypothetical protein
MDIVTILRQLWFRRRLVGVTALVAVLVGLMVAYRPSLPPESRSYKVAIAAAQILVDTPDSQVVDVAPTGAETLGARARLLANLMADGELKAAIARRAGLQPRRLLAVAEGAIDPQTVTPKASRDPNAHLLTTTVRTNPKGEDLPIVALEAQAPDTRGAMKLAHATVTGLRDYLDSKAAVEQVSDARRLRVSGLGSPQVREAVRGPNHLLALVAAVFVFLGGCGIILLASRLAREWREAEAAELGDLGDLGAVPVALESAVKPSIPDEPWPDLSRGPLPLPRTATEHDSIAKDKTSAEGAYQ